MLNVRDLYHHQEEYAGQEVTVVSSLNGNLIINVKGSRIALDQKMAQRVML